MSAGATIIYYNANWCTNRYCVLKCANINVVICLHYYPVCIVALYLLDQSKKEINKFYFIYIYIFFFFFFFFFFFLGSEVL